MINTLAFTGSNSSSSINKKLLTYVIEQIDFKIKTINLSDFKVPIYSIDIEKDEGIPNEIMKIGKCIADYDHLIIAVSEHNGSVSVFFKNYIDWLSRYDIEFLEDKKLFIIGSSPGRGGAKMALNWTAEILPRFGAQMISQFSLSSFNHSFSDEKGIFDDEQKRVFDTSLTKFLDHI